MDLTDNHSLHLYAYHPPYFYFLSTIPTISEFILNVKANLVGLNLVVQLIDV